MALVQSGPGRCGTFYLELITMGISAACRGIAIHSSADYDDGDEVDERVMSAVNPFGGVECSASGIYGNRGLRSTLTPLHLAVIAEVSCAAPLCVVVDIEHIEHNHHSCTSSAEPISIMAANCIFCKIIKGTS